MMRKSKNVFVSLISYYKSVSNHNNCDKLGEVWELLKLICTTKSLKTSQFDARWRSNCNNWAFLPSDHWHLFHPILWYASWQKRWVVWKGQKHHSFSKAKLTNNICGKRLIYCYWMIIYSKSQNNIYVSNQIK